MVAVSIVLVVVVVRNARAAHVEGGDIQLPGAGHDRVGVELETAAFDLDGQRGSFFSTIARADWAATRRLTIRTRVPVHALDLGGIGGRVGLGDVESRVRWRITMSDPLLVAVGYTGQLPTGDAARGLGDGALQLAPYVTAGWRVTNTVVFATLTDTFAVRGATRAYVSYTDPNSDHELRYNLGVIQFFSDVIAANVIANGVTIVTDAHGTLGQTIFTAGAQIGVAPMAGWRFVAGGALPVYGPHRFEWRANAAVLYSF